MCNISSRFYFLVLPAILALFIMPSHLSAESKLSSSLLQKLKVVDSTSLMEVIFMVNDNQAQLNLRKDLSLNYKSKAERHQAEIQGLQEIARESQTDLNLELNRLALTGKAENIKSHWLINALSGRIQAAELGRLADRVDILAIVPSLKVSAIEPSASAVFSPGKITSGVESNLDSIGADSAWSMGLTGQGRIVCSFDAGVEGNHPALSANWKGNDGNHEAAWYDPLDGESFPHTLVEAGGSRHHGTHTMGIMIGHDDISGDTIGVAPGAQWISAAVIDLPYVSLIEAFEWAADPDGDPNTFEDVPDVINHSWGIPNEDIGCNEFLRELIDNTESLGIVNIFAAGNFGPAASSITSPANLALDSLDGFAVGALNHETNAIAYESSRGPSDCDGVSIKPNVVAPGYFIRSAYNGDYAELTGTSMASPHVAGAVAILRQYSPQATPNKIKEALLASCKPLDDGSSVPNNTFGWGLINIPAALAYLTPATGPDLKLYSFENSLVLPGETARGMVYLKNLGADAGNVYGEVSAYDPGLTVPTLSLAFGNIDSGQVAGSALPLAVEVHDTVSPGRILAITVTLSADGGYATTTKIFIRTAAPKLSGNPDFYTLQTGRLDFTVTNFGQYGFGTEAFFPLGLSGFSFDGGPNDLYEAAFLIGSDAAHVSDGARNFAAEPDNDFAVSSDGELIIVAPGNLAPVETSSAFDDSFAENPLGLKIEQKTYNWDFPPDDNFVILEYIFENNSFSSLNDISAGLLFDWDIVSSGQNGGGYIDAEQLAFMYFSPVSGSNRDYRGLAVLNAEGVAACTSWVNQGSLVRTEIEKYASMADGNLQAYFGGRNDYAMIISTGTFSLLPGQKDTAVFAVVAAPSLAELRAAAISARNKYQSVTDIAENDPSILPEKFQLYQNYPNPFNPITTLEFSLKTRAEIRLEIFNILGEKVHTLVDEKLAAGNYRVAWDGTDNRGRNLSSGIYLAALTVSGQHQVRKMVLLK